MKINIEQKLTLDSNQIIVPQGLTDYQVQITIAGYMQVCTVHNGLKSGDKVVLLRAQGGQQYVVVERVAS
jgi:hypothetical protein